MSEQTGQQFINALRRLETANEIDSIVELFAVGCQLGNVVSPRTFEGLDGARSFWQIYRKTLGEVTSEFRNVIEAGDRVALEWTTIGTSPEGKRIDYDGVSILEIEGGRITRFWAYFDPAKLGQEIRV